MRMSLRFEPITSWSTGRPAPVGDPAGEHVAEVAGRAREADRPPARTAAERERGRHVVDDLGHHPGPVDRVHRRQPERAPGTATSANIAFTRSWQSSKVPSTATVCTFGGVDRRHLAALHLAHPTRPGRARRCRRCGRPARRRWPPSRCRPTSPPRSSTRSPRSVEHVVEQPADELQRDVLERERRAVEQLEQPLVVVELHERAHGRVAERWRRRRRGCRRERPRVDLVVDVRRHTARRRPSA